MNVGINPVCVVNQFLVHCCHMEVLPTLVVDACVK